MREPPRADAAAALYKTIVQILVGTWDPWAPYKPFVADRGLRKTSNWL